MYAYLLSNIVNLKLIILLKIKFWIHFHNIVIIKITHRIRQLFFGNQLFNHIQQPLTLTLFNF